jgi:Xaa-Pro aminopeptidase
METSIMSDKEIDWVNAYHEKVWKNISPRVSGDTLVWLEEACKPIAK